MIDCRVTYESVARHGDPDCPACGEPAVLHIAEADWEPTDDEIYGRFGMEGGIGYDPWRQTMDEARRLK